MVTTSMFPVVTAFPFLIAEMNVLHLAGHCAVLGAVLFASLIAGCRRIWIRAKRVRISEQNTLLAENT